MVWLRETLSKPVHRVKRVTTTRGREVGRIQMWWNVMRSWQSDSLRILGGTRFTQLTRPHGDHIRFVAHLTSCPPPSIQSINLHAAQIILEQTTRMVKMVDDVEIE
jgi:hypothetical protein